MPPEHSDDTLTNEGTTPATDPAKDPRMLAMEGIKVQRDGEEEPSTDPVQQVAQQTEPQPVQQVDQTTLQTESHEPELIADGLDKKAVRVKVDGHEIVVPLDQVVRNFQKTSAADRRLQEASRLLEQAKAQTADSGKPPASVAGGETGSDTDGTTGAPKGGQPSPKAKKFIAALFEGDEETAAQALEEVIAGRAPSPTQVDPSLIAQQVTPAIKAQLEWDGALEQFVAANSDIVEDPYLNSMLNQRLDAEMEAGKPYPTALQDAGKHVRDWLTAIGAGKTTSQAPTTVTREDKLARKAGIDTLPAASISAASTQAPPVTIGSVIDEMRKARGQLA